MSRFSAFSIHLGISFLIFLVLAYLVVFQWYPGIFFDNDGGWRGMQIIIAVDLVLGPLLTLIVFKAGKPGLRTDLTLIGLLQAVCLCAGTWVVYSEKPIAVVYTEGRFTVMTADDYRADGVAELPDLRHFPGDNPKWVMVNLPESVEEQYNIRAEVYRSGKTLSSMTELYVPFNTAAPDFFGAAENPAIITGHQEWQHRLDNWLQAHGGTYQDYAFFTFATRYVFGYLIYDRASAEQVGLVTNLDG